MRTDLGRQAVTFTLASTGPLPREEMARLYDLFRASVVVELEVDAAETGPGRIALAAPGRSEER